MITSYLLKQIAPYAGTKTQLYQELPVHLNKYMPIYGIVTIEDQCQFLAQLAQESDSFNTTREYASGQAYEGRLDLGNIRVGDGRRFKGRSLIQTTGRKNYELAGKNLRGDSNYYIKNPEYLERPEDAVMASCYYWKANKISAISNAPEPYVFVHKKWGKLGKVQHCTLKVNGGQNGIADRIEHYKRAKLYLFQATALATKPQEVKSNEITSTATPKITPSNKI